MPTSKSPAPKHAMPHDALVKQIYGRPNEAQDMLRTLLDPQVLAQLDLNTLALESSAYIEPNGTELRSDLLFTVQTQQHRPALIYVLFEHQSSQEHRMSLRILRYMVDVWMRWESENPKEEYLPPILPVLLSHAAGGWRAPVRFHDLFDPELLPILQRYLPSFEFVLDDLVAQSDETLMNRERSALLRLTDLLLKHARTADDLGERWRAWFDMFREAFNAPGGQDAVHYLMRYAVRVSGALSPDHCQEISQEVDRELEVYMASLAEKWVEEGREEGRRIEMTRSLELMLQLKFREQGGAWAAQIEAADLATLERWRARILTVDTIEAVFAE